MVFIEFTLKSYLSINCAILVSLHMYAAVASEDVTLAFRNSPTRHVVVTSVPDTFPRIGGAGPTECPVIDGGIYQVLDATESQH